MEDNKTPLPESNEQIELTADTGGTASKKPQDFAASLYEWLELFAVSFAIVMMIVLLIARHSPVVGSSMINTLHDGDMLIVSDLFYEPKNNDIIVFHSQNTGYDEPYVKRIIATEGQTVDIDFPTWTVTVDGVELDEPYVNYLAGVYMREDDVEFPLTVPEGHIFVMGDNRNFSNDSRGSRIGCVDTRFVFGRVLFRITPISQFGKVN